MKHRNLKYLFYFKQKNRNNYSNKQEKITEPKNEEVKLDDVKDTNVVEEVVEDIDDLF